MIPLTERDDMPPAGPRRIIAALFIAREGADELTPAAADDLQGSGAPISA